MSKRVSAFILLNLGSEMLYVVAQRLKAQNITHERSAHVLDEITSSLIDERLIAGLLEDEAPMKHLDMKELIEKIAQSSIMRLDGTSMDRLWDLITMIFKWQMTLARDTFIITIRHLYEIETFVTSPETQLNLHRVQNTVDNFAKILTEAEKRVLLDSILFWLKDFDIRVSLLLRLGFQEPNGAFKRDNFDGKYAKMLDNLGENIYAASAKHFQTHKTPEQRSADSPHELNAIVEQLLGPTDAPQTDNSQFFKLSFADTFEALNDIVENTADKVYKHINVEATSSFDVFSDVDTQEDVSIHEELIKMLDEKCID